MPRANPDALPIPEAEAAAHSQRLAAQIADEIDACGGAIPFARFMELALYAPGLGYYSAGSRKFGAAGDFITAPELTPLFGHCVAQGVAAILEAADGDEVVEVGAGSGALAAALLGGLARLGRLPRRYAILESSADLRQRQQTYLKAVLPAALWGRLEWLDRLPEAPLRGAVVANELLDALPLVAFVQRGGQAVELGVTREAGGAFGWCELAPLGEPLQARLRPFALAEGARGELGLAAEGWVETVAGLLERGALLLIDYGDARAQLYHPQRSDGTLRCFYRHRVHGDPLILPGLQDITAHVDFTAIAEAADRAGLRVAGYTTQSHYLFDAGLPHELAAADAACGDDTACRAALSQAVQKLTLPGEMGERFKALLLTRGHLTTPPGFNGRDLRARL